MPDDTPHFDDAGRLIAPKYDDVYFSAEDGLAETQHVFLNGNNLAPRLAALQPGETFTVAETGFGTGLNFLAVWQLFEQHAHADARFEFISVEGFPLDQQSMAKALSPWPELAVQREALLMQWGGIYPGVYRLRFAQGRVGLTLLIGEVAMALTQCNAKADAWFLDGFAPSRNPAMWSEQVFAHVARCSKVGTTLATYTAAGFVRRGLQNVGFEITKQPGFGTKRDMTVGRYGGGRASSRADHSELIAARQEPRPPMLPGHAIIIGGSIAGAFAARSLAERGFDVTVIEEQRMSNGELPALSPRVAVLQPKISDINDAAGKWLRQGYADAYRLLCSDDAIAMRAGWQACGTFQAAYDERAERRLRRFVEQFGAMGLCRWVEPEQTAEVTGVALSVGGVLIERAGLLRPAGLCAALLDHARITCRDSTQAHSICKDKTVWRVDCGEGESLQSQTVIIANAFDAKRFKQTSHLVLNPVRGQVTLLDVGREDGQARPPNALRCALFYGGYLLPVVDGVQTLGASFVPGVVDTAWRDEEHADVCEKLSRVLPDEAGRLRSIAQSVGWVGLRMTTPKHRCYAESVGPGLYVSLGHGSHGIASAAAAGQHLADLITQGVVA